MFVWKRYPERSNDFSERFTERYSKWKSLQNDGLTKDFFEIFQNHIKGTYFNSVRGDKLQNLLSASQRLAINKLIDKK